MEDKEKSSINRDITLVTVLGVLLSNIVLGIPELGLQLIILVMLMPVPYIYLFTKYGYKGGNMAIAFTALVNSIFFDIFGLVMTLVSFGFLAVVVGGAFYEELKASTTLLITTITSAVSGMLVYYMSNRIGLVHQYKQIFEENLVKFPLWKEFLPGTISEDAVSEITEMMINLFPGITIIFFMILGYICYLISAKLIRWRGYKVPEVLHIKKWLYPRWIMILYIILEFMPKDTFSVNIVLVLTFILSVEGISVFVYYGDRWGVYSWLRNILIIVGFVFLGFVFFFVGIIDNIFRIRRAKKKNKE